MSQAVEVPFAAAKDMIQRAFPGAKSRRTVKVERRTTYRVSDYWDGGSRNECRFIRLSDMRIMSSDDIPSEQRQKIANPYNLPICEIAVIPGFVVVEHIIFRGKDLGYRLYVAPDEIPGFNEQSAIAATNDVPLVSTETPLLLNS